MATDPALMATLLGVREFNVNKFFKDSDPDKAIKIVDKLVKEKNGDRVVLELSRNIPELVALEAVIIDEKVPQSLGSFS